MDIVVTVPKNFRYGEQRGLAAWLSEGDAPWEEWDGEEYVFSVAGPPPSIEPGERVYVICNGQLVGYAPLVEFTWHDKFFDKPKPKGFARWGLVRGGGAVAVTIAETIHGFRGWRYRWWAYAQEVPIDLRELIGVGQ